MERGNGGEVAARIQALSMNLRVGRVCPQAGIAGTKGGRACCPQRAANVNRHSYNLRAADRHVLPPNRKIFEKCGDSHVYSAPFPLAFAARRAGDRRALPWGSWRGGKHAL